MNKLKILSIVIYSFMILCSENKSMDCQVDNPKKFYHTHKEGKEECNPLAFFIANDATFSYEDGDIKWERNLNQEQDEKLRVRAQLHAYYNHLFIGFDIACRTESGLEWIPIFLFYNSINNDTEFSEEKFKVNKLEDDPDISNIYLVDFYNHSQENNTCNYQEKLAVEKFDKGEVKIPLDTKRISKLQEETKLFCTLNGQTGYHSEGIALSYLLDTNIFDKIIEYIKTIQQNTFSIEGCILKLYSKYEICTSCQSVLVGSRESIENKFNKAIEDYKKDGHTIPMIFVGMGTYYFPPNNYWFSDDSKPECNKTPCVSNGTGVSDYFMKNIDLKKVDSNIIFLTPLV